MISSLVRGRRQQRESWYPKRSMYTHATIVTTVIEVIHGIFIIVNLNFF